MNGSVRIAGIGSLLLPRGRDADVASFRQRLDSVLSASTPNGRPPRLVHRIEEIALLAARDALDQSDGFRIADRERIGIALGVDEGIDGIKADHFRSVIREGPTGASPLLFPLTAPNAVAARLSILLDIRGESFTLCGESLAGAQALGVAVSSVREGSCDAVLAGGVTSIGPDFRDGYRLLDDRGPVEEGEFACILFLTSLQPGTGDSAADDLILGYGEGTGRTALRVAAEHALAESCSRPDDICSVILTSDAEHDKTASLQRLGIRPETDRSAFRGHRSASLPLAVQEALSGVSTRENRTVLVAGFDCEGRCSAIVLRKGGKGRRR